MKGISVVDSILGHEWSPDGYPMVEVKWKHGEVVKGLVKDIYENTTDDNRFKDPWGLYCAQIGETSRAFVRGLYHRDRSEIRKNSKRRKIG